MKLDEMKPVPPVTMPRCGGSGSVRRSAGSYTLGGARRGSKRSSPSGREDELATLLDLIEPPEEVPTAAVLVGEADRQDDVVARGHRGGMERGYRVLSS